MFHYDITAEDHRIIANSKEGIVFQVHLTDNLSGKTAENNLTHEELSDLVAFQLALDGVPNHAEKGYELLNPNFAKLAPELRMIP